MRKLNRPQSIHRCSSHGLTKEECERARLDAERYMIERPTARSEDSIIRQHLMAALARKFAGIPARQIVHAHLWVGVNPEGASP